MAPLVVLNAACATVDSAATYQVVGGETLLITQEVWRDYEKYQRLLGSDKNGAFAVAVVDNVGMGVFYTYCPKSFDRCRSAGAAGPANQALAGCKEKTPDCVIFARGTNIVVRYEIVD